MRLHFELTLQAVTNNFEVQLTHAGHECLTSFLIGVAFESGILLGQCLQANRHFFLVSLGIGLDSHGNHGLREGWRLEADINVRRTQGITSRDVANAHQGSDITGVHGFDILLFVGLDHHDPVHTFLFTGPRVVHRIALTDLAAINAEEN